MKFGQTQVNAISALYKSKNLMFVYADKPHGLISPQIFILSIHLLFPQKKKRTYLLGDRIPLQALSQLVLPQALLAWPGLGSASFPLWLQSGQGAHGGTNPLSSPMGPSQTTAGLSQSRTTRPKTPSSWI